MVSIEPGAKLVFNGDFNWFNADAMAFEGINRVVLQHVALRGNVETELAAIGETQVTYQGVELRQDDEDVWLQALHLAREQPLDAPIEFVPHAFLRAIGWPTTGHYYALLRDAFAVPSESAAPLAEVLLSRTGGNPFFLRAFLTSLHDDGLLERGPQGWRWDVRAIRERGVTDNVGDLLVEGDRKSVV